MRLSKVSRVLLGGSGLGVTSCAGVRRGPAFWGCDVSVLVLAAVSAPSSLAVSLAEESGLTLVAFLREDSMSVYTRADQITQSSASARGCG